MRELTLFSSSFKQQYLHKVFPAVCYVSIPLLSSVDGGHAPDPLVVSQALLLVINLCFYN